MKLCISFDCNPEQHLDRLAFGDIVLRWNQRSIYTYSLHKGLLFKEALGPYIHAHRSAIRKKTLQLLNEVANIKIGSSSLVDYLAIDEHFSLFWPCPVGEKCNIEKSPWLEQLILLAAIHTIAYQECIKEVVTLNADLSTRALIDQLFNADHVKISHWQENKRILNNFITNLCALSLEACGLCLQLVVRPVAAIVWTLRLYQSTLGFKNEDSFIVTEGSTSRQNEKLIFIDYYCYLQSIADESVVPIFWGRLFHYLNQRSLPFELLHHYVPYLSPSSEECSTSAQQLIQSLPSCSRQLFFESILSPLILLQALYAWSKSLLKLPRVAVAFLRSGQPAARLAFKSYIKWQAGTGCFKSLLYYYLYANLFDSLYLNNAKVKIVFLQENLDLEYCLLAVLRKHQNVVTYGYPHSIVRFWDLRFFHLSSECFPSHLISRPRYLPDKILTNGPVNRQELSSFYKDLSLFCDVEATRYEVLDSSSALNNANNRSCQNLCSILLVSGPGQVATSELFKAAVTAVSMLREQYPQHAFCIGLKLHPQCRLSIDSDQYPDLPIKIETKSISSIAHDYDLAVLDSNTSAVVDTLSSHLPSVNYLSGSLVDLSPSSSFTAVESADEPGALVSCIRRLYFGNQQHPAPEIFYFSERYDKWHKLLLN